MISLIISFAVLIAGFLTYGRVAEKAFAPDDRETPAYRLSDGVDYVPMKTWKAFLVQLLNIAGTGRDCHCFGFGSGCSGLHFIMECIL